MSTTTYTVVNGVVLSQNKDGVVHHLIPDPLGSVVMVRDTAGNTVYEAEYAPYGDVQSETGTNPSEFGYVGTLGYVKDSASSLYVRARYLLTNLGRWLTKDPLWPSEPGYVYAGSRPNTLRDPSGLINCDNECKYFHDTQPGLVGDHLGGVICVNGEKCNCYWGPPDSRGVVKKCVKEHERDHFDDNDCPKRGVCRPRWRPGKDRPKEECRGLLIELSCLAKNCPRDNSAYAKACNKFKCDTCLEIQDFCKVQGGGKPSSEAIKICKGCGVTL